MIEYLMHCGSDNTIANTARVSMELDGEWKNLPANYTTEQRDKLIKYLARNQHTSPFRHNSITIRCEVPIFLARQLGKHQVGMSWNEVSRRYVDEPPEFWKPDLWRGRPDGSIKQGSSEEVTEATQFVVDDIYMNVLDVCEGSYQSLLDLGVAPEMARMVLPQSMKTQFIWTGSLMAFAHVYKLRIDGHAQKEAQDFAEELDKVIRPLFPVAWATLTG